MIRSMSGYGRGEASSERARVIAEVRSVNHRFCRVSVRLPPELGALEEIIRRLVQKHVQRGKVDVTVRLDLPGTGPARVDRETATAYARELGALAEELGLAAELDLATLAGLPGVVGADAAPAGDPDRDGALVEAAVEEALESLDGMRRREGKHLATDVRGRLEDLGSGLERVAAAADEVVARTRDQLRDRVAELLEEIGEEVDEARLAQEVVYYAERSDVTEEVVRLRSHLQKAGARLDSAEAVGRSLDFLAQEIHRELNTIGAKSKDLEVAETVVEMKAGLERVREQVQNIE